MTQEQLEKLREKYKSVLTSLGHLGSRKFVSGVYRDIRDLLEEVDRVSAKRDAYKGTAESMGQTNKALAQKLVDTVAERDLLLEKIARIDNIAVGFMEDGPYEDADTQAVVMARKVMDLSNCGEQDPWKQKIMESFMKVE